MGVSHSPPSPSPTIHLPLVTTIKPPRPPQRAQGVPMDALGSAIRTPAPRFKTAAPVVVPCACTPQPRTRRGGACTSTLLGRRPRPALKTGGLTAVRARALPALLLLLLLALDLALPPSDPLPDHLNAPRTSQWTPWALQFAPQRLGTRPRRPSSSRAPARPDRVQDAAGHVPRPSSAVVHAPRSKRAALRPSAPARCPPSSSSSSSPSTSPSCRRPASPTTSTCPERPNGRPGLCNSYPGAAVQDRGARRLPVSPAAPSLLRDAPSHLPQCACTPQPRTRRGGACTSTLLGRRPRPALKTGGLTAVRARALPALLLLLLLALDLALPPSDPLPDHLNAPRTSQWTPWALQFAPQRLGTRPRRPSSAVRLHAPTAYKTRRGVSLVPPRPSPRPALKTGGRIAVRARALPALLLLLLLALDFAVLPPSCLPDHLNVPRASQWTPWALQFVSRRRGTRPRRPSSADAAGHVPRPSSAVVHAPRSKRAALRPSAPARCPPSPPPPPRPRPRPPTVRPPPRPPQRAEDIPMDVLGPSIRTPAPRYKTAAPVVVPDVPMDVLGPSIRTPAPRYKTAAPVVVP
ncbi:uncharacterized protein BXZ73DRAFT_85965, partial [Epithele typhae]|uniref:uncharacterized protein n=1 Tax=Epithele typhae TaxID=378194 RepID=UPI0020078920